jgi:hypothetical protein
VLTERRGSQAYEVLVGTDAEVVAESSLGPVNLPFTDDELEDARAIAVEQERIAELLADRRYGVAAFGPSLDDSGHRLVGLRFLDTSDPDIPSIIADVVVDLAIAAVVDDPSRAGHLHGHDSGGE